MSLGFERLREEERLGVIENGVLWKMSGPKIVQVTGERRRIHNGQLRHLCYSPNMRNTGCGTHEGKMCTGFL